STCVLILSVHQPEFPPLVARSADRPQSILSLPSRRISHALGRATRLAHARRGGGMQCCRRSPRVLRIGSGPVTTAALGCLQPDLRAFRRRMSRAASASSHSRNCVILGTADVAFGQTTQYVLDSLKETSIGLTSRPLMRSQAASVVRASATP